MVPLRKPEFFMLFCIIARLTKKEQATVKLVTEAAKSLMADKLAKLRERGIQKETLRTMIIGIPNAGKSTLMNRLAGKKIAVVGNKPGLLKGNNGLNQIKIWKFLTPQGFFGQNLKTKWLV